MKIILFHPGGSAMFIQQTARAYYEAGMLEKFFLTFAYRPEFLWKGVEDDVESCF